MADPQQQSEQGCLLQEKKTAKHIMAKLMSGTHFPEMCLCDT